MNDDKCKIYNMIPYLLVNPFCLQHQNIYTYKILHLTKHSHKNSKNEYSNCCKKIYK